MGFGYLTVRQSYIEYNNNNIRAPPKLSIKYVHITQGFLYCKGVDRSLTKYILFILQIHRTNKCFSHKIPAEVLMYVDYKKIWQ